MYLVIGENMYAVDHGRGRLLFDLHNTLKFVLSKALLIFTPILVICFFLR